MTRKQLLHQLRGKFVPPVLSWYLGPISQGTPYFLYPRKFCPAIISIRRTVPRFARIPYHKIGKYYIALGWPITFLDVGLGWKDKYGSPRYEWGPFLYFYFFGYQLCFWWNAPDKDNDRYYEMVLWCFKYCDGDIDKARATWGWTEGGVSTWREGYVL
jgi:hypothetical protein